MNQKEIHDLAAFIFKNTNGTADQLEKLISTWVNQQPKEIPVGLTNDQVKDMVGSFIGYFCDDSATYEANEEWNRTEEYLIDSINNYLNKQNLILPKEVAVGLTDEQLDSFYECFDEIKCSKKGFLADYYEWAKTQSFKGAEIAVGLTTDQIVELAFTILSLNANNDVDLTTTITKYLNTQTFVQSKEYAQRSVDRLTTELNKCHEIIKAQKEVKEVAVGLTDEQIIGLNNYLHNISSKRFMGFGILDIKQHLKTQTFALPEVCVKFSDKQLWDLYDDEEVKEIPVGLTDEQIYEIARRSCELGFDVGKTTIKDILVIISDYIKNQTFAQPSEAFKAAMVEVDIRNQEIEKLKDDFVALEEECSKLQKTQQFAPDWDNAPKEATQWVCSSVWQSDTSFIKVDSVKVEKRLEPPKPNIEVGQIYQYKDNTYVVTGIERIKGKTKFTNEWVDGLELVTYHRGKNLTNIEFQSYTRTLDDFVSKFTQVS